MLSPYRVLDLTDERGLLCGQMLGDLGADVIEVEPPQGSTARRIGPFYGEAPHPDRSLFWWAFCRNKRSITMDMEKEEGRALLLRLVKSAHFLIESSRPGRMAAMGLGYEDLAALNPALVYVSITGFGQDGPKAGYAETELTVWASAGPLALAGDEDRAPVRVTAPQAYVHAASEAAVAALVAHLERQRSGLGQHVDVSAQQAAATGTQSNILASLIGAPELQRLSGASKIGDVRGRQFWPAKDGYVSILFQFGSANGAFTKRLFQYIYDQGGCGEDVRDKDWIAYGQLLATGQEPVSEHERAKQVIEDFTRTRTKAELLRASLEHRLLIAPVADMADVAASEQLTARHYWRTVEHPELGETFRYPGPFAKLRETPIAYRRRPPLLGEHNREIYVGELGLSEEQLAELRQRGIV